MLNRQRRFRPAARPLRTLTRFLMAKASRPSADTACSELALVLTDEAQMRDLSRRFLGANETTDVISFRYGAMPGSNVPAAGEIIVNVERAAAEGSRRRGAHHELALYIAHGCDHLMGQDDQTRPARMRMRRRELRWLREAEARGLLNGLFR